ncbi:hypothetical protein Cni_G13366 [Canna indica]|uniref:Uncharacterized protein n=1 Tax=Canna indica TaxID=4628 RepID=A0AAQ3K9R8_9LILI|nr:hypothetical protein Cni_G13366 [Canna indica]
MVTPLIGYGFGLRGSQNGHGSAIPMESETILEKWMKVKKGSLTVRVGLEGEEGSFRKFVIPISYLYHPLFKRLLEAALEAYGYRL